MTVSLGEARVPDGTRIYAIGDVHGCLDELKTMLRQIDADLETNPADRHKIIFVGDYVDRGPNCKGVIKRLIKLKKNGRDVTFLRGNHEEKLERFIDDPFGTTTASFLKYGGRETIASYGFDLGEGDEVSHEKLIEFEACRKKVIPKRHRRFFKALKNATSEGGYFFCHAGVRPGVPFAKQETQDLIWIRQPFLDFDKPLKKVVVHGHTPKRKPDIRINRINIDTRCVYGGALTCVVLEADKHRFISVPAKQVYWRKS